MPGGSDELNIDTGIVSTASQDLYQITLDLKAVSDAVISAQANLADYDSPHYSDEIKTALQNWLNIVGDTPVPPMYPGEPVPTDTSTMIARVYGFAVFLQQVAETYMA